MQPLGSHSVVGRYINRVGGGIVFNGQPQICDDRRAVLFHKDVFRFKVSVRNARFACNKNKTDEDQGRKIKLKDTINVLTICSEQTQQVL